MIQLLAAALLGGLSAPAQAASNEISLDLGNLYSRTDDAWDDVFGGYEGMTTYGGRIGYAVTPRVAVIANYNYGAAGAEVQISEDEDYDYASFQAAYYGHNLALGVKADVEPLPWLKPYVALQGLGQIGMIRLDDDPNRDDNPNQIQDRAFAPGGVAAVGLDLTPLGHRSWSPATHLEAGYGLAAKMNFEDVGDLAFGGFYLRWGLGVRF